MDSIIDKAKYRACLDPSNFAVTTVITEAAMGYIIIVVAVLLSHILIKPVESMKPKMIRFPPVPVNFTIDNAIRLCKCHFSIASPIMKPPIKRKITSFAYGAAASPILETPINGNNTNGMIATTGIGMASEIHHEIINMAIAKTLLAAGSNESGFKSNIKQNKMGPVKNANLDNHTFFCSLFTDVQF